MSHERLPERVALNVHLFYLKRSVFSIFISLSNRPVSRSASTFLTKPQLLPIFEWNEWLSYQVPYLLIKFDP